MASMKYCGWRARSEARRVGEPPRFRRELHDVLFAFGIDDVVAKAACRDKRGVPRDFAGPLQEFSGSEPSETKCLSDLAEVFVAERGPGHEVHAQDVEHGWRNHVRFVQSPIPDP